MRIGMHSSENVPLRLKNYSLPEVTSLIIGLGEQKFRAQQIIKWIYQKRSDDFSNMTTFSKPLREKLGTLFTIHKMRVHAQFVAKEQDAVKFVFELIESPHFIESVVLIDGRRRTACLSSQLGCGLGCVFCVTGRMGFIRNLSQEEIVGQLIGINDFLVSRGDKTVTNVVFMGMGEALSNFDALRTSLDIIMNEDTFNIGGRRVTVSTAGVVPSIERLMAENLNVGLAISLNAFSDEERNLLMPINKRYSIASLIAIAKKYYEKTGRRVTFEYVLISGKNDTPEAAAALGRLLSGFPCKINCIPLNDYNGTTFNCRQMTKGVLSGATDATLTWFVDELHRRGLSATIRKSRGRDIGGACGQLAGGLI